MQPKKKKMVLVAGEPSHGPGEHEYEKTVRLLKAMLDQSPLSAQMEVVVVLNGWPEDTEVLEQADAVLFTTDGRDAHLFRDVPFVASPERQQLMARLMARGCGLILLHFSTFYTRAEGAYILDWAGGYFEWEDEQGERNWYSRIVGDGSVLALDDAAHPVTRGVEPQIALQDEIYYNLRLVPDDPRRTPIWRVPELAGDGDMANLVGWTLNRQDGGRTFVTTAGHRYNLFEDDSFRKLHLNALVWAAGLEVPAGGVPSRYYADDLVEQLLDAPEADSSSAARTVHALLISGNQQHRWHNWEQTEPLIREALHEDAGIAVTSVTSIEALAEWDLSSFDTIILNYCNWQDPAGISEPARAALLAYLQRGGGLVVLHFANGAFHFSLPEAGASDWPEYRRIVPRVWDHHDDSAHDPYGTFTVEMVDREHPITAGIPAFEITDELYYDQRGDQEVHVLYEAQSVVTGRMEPLAWTSSYSGAPVVQTLLGHDAAAYESPEVREMLRRSVRWVANA
ncbi:putative large multi-functional protein [Paenibacillus sp. 598K]|uniref:ThuA domain-containing protein n=1 Tax=Paenibacillus sp. 598K TaxID=1117987 RepID=UPI000FF9BECF|nr:ThuA domain-containing protein [Paenibacillus sp. 598K]GBF77359.1 putative large multi-functional protein [Paenibacillus sp. 598K]